MKHVSRLFIFIFIQFLIAGCAKQPSLPHIGVILEVHGSPHIVQKDVCYYVGSWGPGAVVLKIYYEDTSKTDAADLPRYFYAREPYFQQVTSIEWEYIEEDRLHFYIPLLIESLKDTEQGGTGSKALSRLHNIVNMMFPDGYGDYYMHATEDIYTGTPFEGIGNATLEQILFPDVDETTYEKWIQWWNTEGHKIFDIYKE